MHGSIDWFDRGRYNEKVKQATDYPQPYHVKHPLFAPDTLIESQPIVDGPRFTDDPLLQIYRVKNPGMVYAGSSQYWECSPFLLNPSHGKLLYVKPLIEFWRGWGRAGGLQLGLGIIGYSLPDYDDYARQLIYKLSKNYQEYEPDFELNGRVKRPVRVLDFRAAESDQAGLRARYQFMNPKRTQYWYDGLSEKGIEWFMA